MLTRRLPRSGMSRLTRHRFLVDSSLMGSRISLTTPEPENPEARRRRLYATAAAEANRAWIDRRLRRLPSEVQMESALAHLHRLGDQELTEVRVRRPYIRLSQRRGAGLDVPERGDPARGEALARFHKEDRGSRPPAARLARHHRSLSLHLTMLYVAQITTSPGVAPRFRVPLVDKGRGWTALIGLDSEPRTVRQRKLHRALSGLETARLLELPEDRGGNRQFGKFRLLLETTEDDTGYTVPGATGPTGMLALPVAFFWRGWHLVLEPTEILTLFMFMDLANHHPAEHTDGGVAAPMSERWARYAVSGEAYERHRLLSLIGLLEPHDPLPHRESGKVDVGTHGLPEEPIRFKVNRSRLSDPSLARTREALAAWRSLL